MPTFRSTALIAALAAHATAQSPAPPPADVVSWWDGDAVAGGIAADLFGQSPATVIGAAATGPGLVGSAFTLDGLGGHLATGSAVLATTGAFTVEAWVLPAPGSSVHRVIAGESHGSGSRQGEFQLRLDPGGHVQLFRHMLNNNSVLLVATASPIPPGVWTHVAGVYRAPGLQVWVNGQLASGAQSASAYSATAPAQTTIGAAPGGIFGFEGAIDEVAVYRRDLSATEIARIVAAGTHGKTKAPAAPPAGLASWWDADHTCSSFALDVGEGDSAALVDVGLGSGMAGVGFVVAGGGHLDAGRPVVATTGAFTVEAWVRPDRTDIVQAIASEIGATSGSVEGQHLLRINSDGRMQFYHEGAAGARIIASSPTSALQSGQWSHVAAVCDPAAAAPLRLYVDGQGVGSAPSPTGYTRTAVPVATRIGTADRRFDFEGRIDEVTYYRRALGGVEIFAIYRAGAFGKDRSLGNAAACLSGSGEDFHLLSDVNGAGNSAAPQKTVLPGDFLGVTLWSSGAFVRTPPFLLGELYLNGAPPAGLLPGVHLGPALTVLFASQGSVVGPIVLPPAGLTLGFVVPPGLAGATLRLQALALSPTAGNGVFAASPAHDFRAR